MRSKEPRHKQEKVAAPGQQTGEHPIDSLSSDASLAASSSKPAMVTTSATATRTATRSCTAQNTAPSVGIGSSPRHLAAALPDATPAHSAGIIPGRKARRANGQRPRLLPAMITSQPKISTARNPDEIRLTREAPQLGGISTIRRRHETIHPPRRRRTSRLRGFAADVPQCPEGEATTKAYADS